MGGWWCNNQRPAGGRWDIGGSYYRTAAYNDIAHCSKNKKKHCWPHLHRVKSGLAEKRGSKDITNRTINCKPTCTMGTTDSHTSSLIPSQSSEVLGFLSSPGRQFPFEIICTMGSNRSSHADTRFIQKPSTDQLLRSSFWSFNQNSRFANWVLETIWK